MRIYYFGKLIQKDDSEILSHAELMDRIGEIDFFSKAEPQKQKTEILEQTQLQLQPSEQVRKAGMQSIGDILKDIDMNLDSFRPKNKQSLQYQ